MYFEFDDDEMESLKNIVLFLYHLYLLQSGLYGCQPFTKNQQTHNFHIFTSEIRKH